MLVIAHAWDTTARVLREESGGQVIACLTPADLSKAGWHYRVGDAAHARIVTEAGIIEASRITGVLTRLSAVTANDLPHIQTEDQGYVAAEMTACLAAFLTELTCSVLNRPTPVSLAGPAWQQVRWHTMAAPLGLPVVPVRHVIRLDATPTEPQRGSADDVTVTIVGRHSVGNVDPALVEYARQLADAAGAESLSVVFSGTHRDATLVRVECPPAVVAAPVARAILDYFAEKGCAAAPREEVP